MRECNSNLHAKTEMWTIFRNYLKGPIHRAFYCIGEFIGVFYQNRKGIAHVRAEDSLKNIKIVLIFATCSVNNSSKLDVCAGNHFKIHLSSDFIAVTSF